MIFMELGRPGKVETDDFRTIDGVVVTEMLMLLGCIEIPILMTVSLLLLRVNRYEHWVGL
jgi:hypothetical protein